MPWDRPETWDTTLFDAYKRLIALRRSSDALARGSIRYAYVDDDVIAYLRETRDERLLCLASRAAHDPIRLPFTSLETLYGDDAEGGLLPADGPSFHVWRLTNG
jgi:alpha-glucosidase